MKNKKIKAGKGFFRGKMRYVFFLMVCMIPLLAVQGYQNYQSNNNILPCFDLIDEPVLDETVTYEACDSFYGLSTIESSANVTVASGNKIRLLPGFKANNGSFFHAYINDGCVNCAGDDVPAFCDRLNWLDKGCCQYDTGICLETSEALCCRGTKGFKNGKFKKGWKCVGDKCEGSCETLDNAKKGCCWAVAANGEGECIPEADTDAKCCNYGRQHPHVDVFFRARDRCIKGSEPNAGYECVTPTCTDTDPTTRVCCVIDGSCQGMSEQACCEAGGDPSAGEVCIIDGNVACSVITSGNCYRCNWIDDIYQVEEIAPFDMNICVTNPSYRWSSDIISVGESCPASCPPESIEGCCYFNGGCLPTTDWECCLYEGYFFLQQCGINDCPGDGSGSAKLSTENITVEIFPNPNNGTFTFKLDSPLEGILDMKIFDMTGRVVYEEASSYIFSGEYQKEIQLPASSANGMYNVAVTVGEGQINKRIVIQR